MYLCKRFLFFSLFIWMSSIGPANASFVSLSGGVADPFNMGPSPIPPNEPIPFTAENIVSMTDGSLSTGFTFTSSQGLFSSDPDRVIGFGMRYDFDASSFANIQQVDFSWTGLMTWEGTTFPDMRIGSEPGIPQTSLNFGTSTTPDGTVKTGSASFFESNDSRFDIDGVLNGDLISIWVLTELGSSDPGVVDHLTIDTLEVNANITGTLIPEPNSLLLLMSGLAGIGLLKRRKGR